MSLLCLGGQYNSKYTNEKLRYLINCPVSQSLLMVHIFFFFLSAGLYRKKLNWSSREINQKQSLISGLCIEGIPMVGVNGRRSSKEPTGIIWGRSPFWMPFITKRISWNRCWIQEHQSHRHFSSVSNLYSHSPNIRNQIQGKTGSKNIK